MLEPQEYIRKYGVEQAREYYELIKNKPLFSFDADMPRKYKEVIEAHEQLAKRLTEASLRKIEGGK